MGWLTAPSSIYGIKASGLERLRTCAYARMCVGPNFYLQVWVASATLPAKGIRVSTLLLVIALFMLV